MYGKALNNRECKKVLRENGFQLVRTKGDHEIFKNNAGITVTITRGVISQKTWQRECKRAHIFY